MDCKSQHLNTSLETSAIEQLTFAQGVLRPSSGLPRTVLLWKGTVGKVLSLAESLETLRRKRLFLKAPGS